MGKSTVRAWQVVRYGRPSEALTLASVPEPEPAPGEVMVQIATSVCNYNEVDGCHGRYLTINPPLPYTLGMEFVGDVVAAGEGAEAWVGRRVMGDRARSDRRPRRDGGRTGRHVLRGPTRARRRRGRRLLLPVPPGLPGAPRTRPPAGRRDGSGPRRGGRWAARRSTGRGRRRPVIATAGSPAKVAMARPLGAAVAIDYRSADFQAAVLQATEEAWTSASTGSAAR